MSDSRVPPVVGDGESESDKLRLGGMALRNGLLVHGPTHWAAAVRDKDGEIQVASGHKPSISGGVAGRVPGVRGVVKLAEAMAVIPLVKSALPAAKLPMQDVRTLGVMAAAALAGQAVRSSGGRTVAREGAVGVISMAPALFALSSGDLAAYHGVEHKSIAAYENDGEAGEATKEHDRCGSNLVAPMLGAAALGNAAARRAGVRGPATDAAIALGSAAVAVEIFAWSERNEGNRMAQAFKRPGYEIQRLIGTREPTERQLEVGNAALDEILRVEKRDG